MTTPWHQFDYADDFYIKAPITFEMMRFLAQNPEAVAEGADGAPRISRRAIHPGGSGVDGEFDSGDSAPTQPGYYEYEEFHIASKTFPYLSIIRVNGDASISGTLTIDTYSSTSEQNVLTLMNCIKGAAGTDAASGIEGGAGGASIGNGGDGSNSGPAGATGYGSLSISRRYLEMRLAGGRGGAGFSGSDTAGGGILILIVHGDLDMSSGGSIRCNGAAGSSASAGAGGGGGGGTLVVVCTGTITDGDFQAKGGAGGDENTGSNTSGGGGGGGYVAVVASAYVGVQTLSAAGGGHGSSGGGATSGGTGTTQKITMTEAEINGILLRGRI